MSRKTGKVKFFDANRGFGFIKCDDSDDEVFVHVTAVKAGHLGDIGEGDRLSFVIEKTGKGNRAVELQMAK